MESNGYKVEIKMEMPDKTVKEVSTYEELQGYASDLNKQAMTAIGAVPVNHEKAG